MQGKAPFLFGRGFATVKVVAVVFVLALFGGCLCRGAFLEQAGPDRHISVFLFAGLHRRFGAMARFGVIAVRLQETKEVFSKCSMNDVRYTWRRGR